jgi:hypothetical protein
MTDPKALPALEIGDRVRLIDNDLLCPRGSLATVVEEYAPGHRFVRVKWNEDTQQSSGGYYPEHFALAYRRPEAPSPSSSPGERGEIERLAVTLENRTRWLMSTKDGSDKERRIAKDIEVARDALLAAFDALRAERDEWKANATEPTVCIECEIQKQERVAAERDLAAARASLSRVRGALQEIAAETYTAQIQIEDNTPVEEREREWCRIALRYRAVAARALAALTSSAPGAPAEPARDDGLVPCPEGILGCLCQAPMDRPAPGSSSSVWACGSRCDCGCHKDPEPCARCVSPVCEKCHGNARRMYDDPRWIVCDTCHHAMFRDDARAGSSSSAPTTSSSNDGE